VKVEARVEALGVLYADDRNPERLAEDSLSAKASRFVEGVRAHSEEIDAAINAAAIDWRVERMAAVDRNVLRIAVYELGWTDTPRAVVMNEAVEMAKTYSTTKSGSFVNGVLDKVVKNLDETETPEE